MLKFMFKFLKDKLKGAIEKFTKKVGEEVPEKEVEIVKEEIKEEVIKEKPKKEKKVKEKKEKIKAAKKEKAKEKKPKEEIIEEVKPEVKEEIKEEIIPIIETKEEKKSFFGIFKKKPKEEKEESIEPVIEIKEEKKKGFFEQVKEKITTKVINEKQFDEMFWDLEMALLENNVAVEVIEKIKDDLKKDITNKPIKRNEVEKEITESLKKSIEDLFNVSPINLLSEVKSKQEKPYIIVFVGINGSGKTTTIAKVAHFLQKNDLKVVLAAADTFRAAAIQQLEEHGEKLGIKVIKHDYGSDPAAVAFDAIKHAKAKNLDVVLIDTAGRLHSNTNLVDEMKKIVRVTHPDLKIFVGESITGNDVVTQSDEFNQAIGIDGIILTKSDVDEKGGAIISVSYVTQRPIMFLGCGQLLEDLKPFDKDEVVKNLGL